MSRIFFNYRQRTTFMKIRYFWLFTFALFSNAHGMDSSKVSVNKKKHSVYDNYKIGRHELFKAIKEYDIERCKELFKKYKDLAHTQCEIEKGNTTTHYLPLWYLFSLEKEDENKENENKLAIAHIIIAQTTDIEWLYQSFYFTLEQEFVGKNSPVTNLTIETFKKIFDQKNKIFNEANESKNKEAIRLCKEIEKTMSFNISLFGIHFNAQSETDKKFLELLLKHR